MCFSLFDEGTSCKRNKILVSVEKNNNIVDFGVWLDILCYMLTFITFKLTGQFSLIRFTLYYLYLLAVGQTFCFTMWFFCNVDVHYLKTDHGGNFQLKDYDGQDCYLTVLYKKILHWLTQTLGKLHSTLMNTVQFKSTVSKKSTLKQDDIFHLG